VIWVIVISVAAMLVVISVWLLRDASPQPPGRHSGSGRARRRDPHDPIRSDDEEPPGQP
jgi:hypothetical protein